MKKKLKDAYGVLSILLLVVGSGFWGSVAGQSLDENEYPDLFWGLFIAMFVLFVLSAVVMVIYRVKYKKWYGTTKEVKLITSGEAKAVLPALNYHRDICGNKQCELCSGLAKLKSIMKGGE